MDNLTEDKSDTQRGRPDSPAIAVFAHRESDPVVGTILRIRKNGNKVFLVANENRHKECIEFANRLDVPVVYTSPGEDSDRRDRVRQTVRNHGYPGVILHEDPTEPIDFEQSTTSVLESNDYLVESVYNSKLKTKPTVLVAIPAYNEANTITEVVMDASEYADEVLVVDDGSDDSTADAARHAGATVVEHDRNRGYGAALKTAFSEAERSNAAHLVILDGDGQHDPSDIQRMVDRQQETGAELVIGCRFTDRNATDVPTYRRIGLAVVNGLTNLSLGVVRQSSRVRDTQNGFRAYNRRAIESLSADETIGDHMGASTDILHHAFSREYDIEEVETVVDYDVENGSSHNPIQHGITLVSNLLTTVERERPLLALAIPGFLVACVGLGFGYWTFSNYISTSVFPMGLAVTSVFFTLAGVFTVFTGIILHALKQHLRELGLDTKLGPP